MRREVLGSACGACKLHVLRTKLPAMRHFTFLALAAAPALAGLVDVPEHGLRIERGFQITQFSDEKLANDIWCMALNPRGEVVVSGNGYVATLLDSNGDGRADKRVDFARLKGGAMGIAFGDGGKQVLIMAEGWLSEYRDNDLDRIADGEPRRLFRFASGEHGGHAIRRGPDGWWWVIGGNDAGISKLVPAQPEGGPFMAGAIVRISADLTKLDVFASGFRNPYDFDFNESGDVFTYDSDCERDYFLPWYSGCRVYHVRPGKHHGWRLPGYTRSFRVPDYMPETVPALADLGRGSPTGVHIYKGNAFPAHYRGGLFVEDWTFGKIWHLPLVKRGEGFATVPEVFIEPIGTHGFAPTDIVETADGALFVSIGGRKTRGAVYRITATKEATDSPPPLIPESTATPGAIRSLAETQTRLGGSKLTDPSAEAFAPYEPARPGALIADERRAALASAQDSLASLDPRIVAEAARVCAMLDDNSAISATRILGEITAASSATDDFHFLACLARMKFERDAESAPRIAAAILDLDRKLAGGDKRPKQNWAVRLNEVVARHIGHDPALADALIAGFKTPGHVALVDALPKRKEDKATRRFFEIVKSDPEFAWPENLVPLLSELPEARPLLRRQWANAALRPVLRPVLRRDATVDDTALLDQDKPALPDPAAAIAFVKTLEGIVWKDGDIARGEKIFRDRACAGCHTGTSPIGPDLSGAAARLSPADLMMDTQFPDRTIGDAFRATLFTLKDGTRRNAFVAFASADGVIIQTGPGATERLAEGDIVSREPSPASLMPSLLLSGLSPGDIADLQAYLRTFAK